MRPPKADGATDTDRATGVSITLTEKRNEGIRVGGGSKTDKIRGHTFTYDVMHWRRGEGGVGGSP